MIEGGKEETSTLSEGKEILQQIRQSISPEIYEKALKAPKLLATIGDYVWGLAVISVVNQQNTKWPEIEHKHQAYIQGKFQIKVAKRLGIEEEISKRYPKVSDHRVHETFEALLGAYWLEKSEIPVELIKRMLNTLSEEERLPIRTEDDILKLKYPGSRIEFSKDEKGIWTASLIGSGGEVIESVERGKKRGLAQKALRRKVLDQK